MAEAVRAVTFDYWNTIVRADADQGIVPGTGVARGVPGHRARRRRGAHPHRLPHGLGRAPRVLAPQRAVPRGAQPAHAAVDLVGPAGGRGHPGAGSSSGSSPPGRKPGSGCATGIDVALEELRRRGVRLGIICDVGFTPSTGLRRMLEGFGLLEHFSGWSFSDDVGWYKPAPEIFEHALGYLGARAGRRRPRR